MRTKQEIDATKQALIASLTNIIDGYHRIDAEMGKLPHRDMRVAHQSLDARTGQHVMHREDSITADYIASDGKRYSISIGRI
jgi:hypothetical protein